MSATREQDTFHDLAASDHSQCEGADSDLCPSDASDWDSSLEPSPRRRSVDKAAQLCPSGACDPEEEMRKLVDMYHVSISVNAAKPQEPTFAAAKPRIVSGTELPAPVRFVRRARRANPESP